ncbi:hypothetical protein [Leuconostoc fallax]|uniref:hypothetical protein n=1 Tax=Leuconostoc fallax TaxID=1251 RepID=UPI00338FF382
MGVATQLIRKLESQAYLGGYKKTLVETDKNNRDTVGLYLNMSIRSCAYWLSLCSSKETMLFLIGSQEYSYFAEPFSCSDENTVA